LRLAGFGNGISPPGTGEKPRSPGYVDGRQITTLQGTADEIAGAFVTIIDEYVDKRFSG